MGITQSLKEAAIKLRLLEDGQQADKKDDNKFETRPLITPTPLRPEGNQKNNPPEAKPGALATELDLLLSSGDPIEAIYQLSNLSQLDFTAEQMLDILDLVSDTPAAKKSQGVEIHLKSAKRKYGATPQSIAQDAKRKVHALTGYVKTISDEVEKEVAERQKRIDELQKEIESAQQEIEQWKQRSEQATQLCRERIKRLKEVVEYFGADVSASD